VSAVATRSEFPGAHWLPAAIGSGWSQSVLDEARAYAQTLDTAAVMIVHRGRTVYQWGDVAARYKCHSIRKSLLSALIGIHVHARHIDLERSLADLGIDDRERLTERERAATILDLLTARSGIYHPTHYETERMVRIKPARHSHGPGTWWCYNNWDFNALGTIFEQLVGRSLFEEFRDRIAAPLAMEDFRYDETRRDGEYVHSDVSVHAAYPFRLSARDLARFGLLYLHGGRWNGTQVIPEKWVRMSVRPYSAASDRGAYGYMWWVAHQDIHFPQMSVPHGTYSARGARGHYVVVIPARELVVVHRVDTDITGHAVTSIAFGALLERILDAMT
jgi:CubicO group peptidase (beta-lactamase class C family)